MAALVWGAWGEEWALNEKVSFNGVTRLITVNAGVTTLDLRADVYSAWVRWAAREANLRFLPAMRAVGADPIPGGETGLTFFLQNGWRLVYDPALVAVSGVLYSEDFPTPYLSPAGDLVYPATVAALVNSAVSTQNVVTGTALTPEQTASAVWLAAQRTLTANPGPSKEEVAAQVRLALSGELARILELAAINGLLPGTPLTVTTNSRTAGDVTQSIATQADGTTTVERVA
jgi:hypothetical protein